MSFGIRMIRAAAAASLSVGVCVSVAAPAIEPGQYVYVEGGSAHGVLSIHANRFTLETIGGNCHTCSLSGTVDGHTAVATDSGGVCRIALSGDGRRVLKLDSAGADACRDNCGARAGFDGEYRRPPAACTDRQRSARIEQSHRQYAAKDYDAARATLTAVLSQCAAFMDWIERDKAKSDLALAEYHRGDRARCAAVLADTVAVQRQKDDAFGLPPCDAENYQSTGKAILHNLALCQAAAKP